MLPPCSCRLPQRPTLTAGTTATAGNSAGLIIAAGIAVGGARGWEHRRWESHRWDRARWERRGYYRDCRIVWRHHERVRICR
ncbi:hypothetical protein ACFS32_19780 [Novosphingobium pokkalii]|uniref:hypothetical protein n=1 Tax=Novosphingobium pokkalii TaxID=1770194 RepID=UPI00362ACDA2